MKPTKPVYRSSRWIYLFFVPLLVYIGQNVYTRLQDQNRPSLKDVVAVEHAVEVEQKAEEWKRYYNKHTRGKVDSKANREYTVAHWDYGHWNYFYGPWEDLLEVKDCPVRCKVVREFADEGSTLKVDALISSLFVMAPPEARARAERNVLFLLEATEKYGGLKDAENDFDWTSYYERTSDIPFPYREFGNDSAFLNKPVNKKNDTLIAGFISTDHGWRTQFVEELMKYIPIDHYGPLFHNVNVTVPKGDHMHPLPGKTPMDMLYDAKIEVLKQYKFTLVFENTIANDYVTEKIYHPFMAASVPIYKGAPNIKEYLPGPHSAILVDEFASPKELAEYILDVGNNEYKYKQFFEYQNYGISQMKHDLVDIHVRDTLPCKVCMKLANDPTLSEKKL